MVGLAAGAAPVNEATAALGRFSTASDRAKARVADLTAQVARNRKEMADLREQAVRTGDADGTLAARMQGLSVATGKTSVQLQAARRDLRAVDGGLIDAVKSATNLSGRFDALKVAAGNLISAGVQRLASGITSGLVGSAEAAMNFEKALVDVAKVAKDADLTKEGLLDPRVEKGIKDVAKDLGVMPTEVAELTAQITAAFSGKTDIVALASDVTKIGVAWDISGKQAGEFFKQTSAGLQLNADETKLLFGSINQLGNELGIKSSEIAEAMTRSAGVLKGANLSGETGAALNATLIKAGASAEVAATGVRTFIARLGAGEAATDKQITAFNALGLSAEKVAKNLASGDAAKAEAQIQEVVAALVKMGESSPDKRMATLIQLFGSESIGSIGAAATAVDTLAQSFAIAGDKQAALTSVQQEYDRVSNTTAARVEKLKANIGVLAIEMGEKLLPYVDQVVNFLTSPEGQKWGADTVATAAKAVTGLAEAVGILARFVGGAVETFGGLTTAVVGLGFAVAALTGPFGLALAAGLALGAGIAAAVDSVFGRVHRLQVGLLELHRKAKDIENEQIAKERAEGVAESDAASEQLARERRAQAATDRWERREREKAGKGLTSAQSLAITRRSARMREELIKGQFSSGTTFEDRIAAFEGGMSDPAAGDDGTGSVAASSLHGRGKVDLSGFDEESKRRIFQDLVSRRKRLKPSEQKMLRALSKDLDMRVPTGGGGRGHKQTKMDRQLAAMDPSLAAVLRTGGEEDAGGDLKVHDDPLSKAVFQRANAGAGGLGGLSSGSGGLGPGPNINNHNYFNTFSVQQQIDARGNGDAAQNIAASANVMAQEVNRVQFTGVERVLAAKNSGGRIA
jgi:TP901 family phage tail tape measure protein